MSGEKSAPFYDNMHLLHILNEMRSKPFGWNNNYEFNKLTFFFL